MSRGAREHCRPQCARRRRNRQRTLGGAGECRNPKAKRQRLLSSAPGLTPTPRCRPSARVLAYSGLTSSILNSRCRTRPRCGTRCSMCYSAWSKAVRSTCDRPTTAFMPFAGDPTSRWQDCHPRRRARSTCRPPRPTLPSSYRCDANWTTRSDARAVRRSARSRTRTAPADGGRTDLETTRGCASRGAEDTRDGGSSRSIRARGAVRLLSPG